MMALGLFCVKCQEQVKSMVAVVLLLGKVKLVSNTSLQGKQPQIPA